MKNLLVLLTVGFFLSANVSLSYAQQTGDAKKVVVKKSEKTLHSQWDGKKVVFLGDSMTDKTCVGTTCVYWEYLTELLGIKPLVYGINGHSWNGILQQAQKLYNERKDSIDAIIIFAGTNDYNGSTPLGTFFTETMAETNHNGRTVMRKHREPIFNDTTFCGRVNKAFSFLKQHYGNKQIIVMTPIHRAYAKFGAKNIQPDENFSNGKGLYIDAYVDILKQAAEIWSVPVIDLFGESGLYPLYPSNDIYFHNVNTDRLHPNAVGDYRIAKTMQYHLLSLPATVE